MEKLTIRAKKCIETLEKRKRDNEYSLIAGYATCVGMPDEREKHIVVTDDNVKIIVSIIKELTTQNAKLKKQLKNGAQTKNHRRQCQKSIGAQNENNKKV